MHAALPASLLATTALTRPRPEASAFEAPQAGPDLASFPVWRVVPDGSWRHVTRDARSGWRVS